MDRRASPIDASWYQRPPGLPEQVSAGGVVVRYAGGLTYAALVRDGREQLYVLPKGHVEPGESFDQAARREIEEEAGLAELHYLTELGRRSRLSYSKRVWKVTHYFLYRTSQVDGKPTDAHKPYELRWFPLDRLPPLFWPEQRETIEQARAWLAAQGMA